MARQLTKGSYLFTVEGAGDFPFDMLRYDQCWPFYGEDSSKLSHFGREAGERRRVVMESLTCWPTERRWQSFGWQVVERGYPDENSRKVAGIRSGKEA